MSPPESTICPPAVVMTDDDRHPAFTHGRVSSFRWRVGDRENLNLRKAVSACLKVSEDEAAALIEFGSVHVKGRRECNPSTRLSGGEEVAVAFSPYGVRRFYEIDPLRMVFRDRFLFIYDKEAGIPSQQTPYDGYNNVFAALLRYLARDGTGQYAAIHNRLDRETSGLLVFAIEKRANGPLGRAFQQRQVKKEYLAWVEGVPENDSWTRISDIGKVGGRYTPVKEGKGRKAQTFFRVIRREEARALLIASPVTGRTHQIRIHLAEAGHPVVGDSAYGAKPDRRLYLHAWRLTLAHPISGKLIGFEAPEPADWPASG